MEHHDGDIIHLIPVADWIPHEADTGCICGPTREPVNTPTGWRLEVHHHRLDGGA